MEEYIHMGFIYGAWRRKASEALLPFGITFQQYQLVAFARRKGAAILSTAARELGMDRPTLTLVVRKCVEAGWLTRSVHFSDKRSSRIALTGEGEELLDRIEAARLFAPESTGDAFDILGSDERAELRRMLDRASRRARDIYAGWLN
ncbi:MAG: MarR family transcriptional regulator [Rectinemataceae bacterium]|nr:MarR family transcriptional regulator [Rectinemataceae bacterium]